jgi:hypothetical protein
MLARVRLVLGTIAVLLVALLAWLAWGWAGVGSASVDVATLRSDTPAPVAAEQAAAADGRREADGSDAPAPPEQGPSGRLTVRVLDARGAPVPNCPVRWLAWPDRESQEGRQDLVTLITDHAGAATLEPARPSRGPWLSAQVYCVGGNATSPRVAADALPVDRLVVRLPSMASLTVRVLGPDGRACPCEGEVRVEWLRAGVVVDQETASFSPHHGIVRWPRIAADVSVRAWASLTRGGRLWTPATATIERKGPFGDGENVDLTLATPSAEPWLCGRACRADGTSLGNTWLRGLLRIADEQFSADAMTDDAGRFYLPCGVRHSRQQVREGSFEVVESTPPMLATVEARPVVGPGLLDLGTLVFSAGTLLAAGMVVDDRGEPVPRADLQLERAGPGSERLTVETSPQDGMVRVFQPGGGRFEVRGAFLRGDEGLSGRCAGHVEQDLQVRSGATDLRLVLPVAGSVNLWGRVPDRFSEPRMWLHLRRAGETGGSRSFGGGYWSWSGLLPGTYELSFWEPSSGATRSILTGIVVPRGGESLDPRLRDLDLGPWLGN